jgi:hypothetical protein
MPSMEHSYQQRRCCVRACMHVCTYVCMISVRGAQAEQVSSSLVSPHTSAYVSIRHTVDYVSIRQHTSAYVSIRQHTSYAYLSSSQAANAHACRRMPTYADVC